MKWMIACGMIYAATALGLIAIMGFSTYDMIRCDTTITVSVNK